MKQRAHHICPSCQDAAAIEGFAYCQTCFVTYMAEMALRKVRVRETKCEWCGARTTKKLLCQSCESLRIWDIHTPPAPKVGWTIVMDGHCASVEAPPERERLPIRVDACKKNREASRAVCVRPGCGHLLTQHKDFGYCWAEGANCECTKAQRVA